MAVIGIDPGLSGAACLMRDDGLIHELVDLPVVPRVVNKSGDERGEIDAYALAAIIDRWGVENRIDRAAVELVGTFRTDGRSGAFSFGEGAGTIRGVLAAHFIPTERVPPPTWRKAIGIPARITKGDKRPIAAKATELWPEHAHLWRAKCHADRAEAALIALWCLRCGG